MSDIPVQLTPQTESECQAVLTHLLAEMHHLNEQIRRDQADIDRLKAESEHLRIEGIRLDAEARIRINSLHKALDQLGGTK
jgi:hypothetical protein